MPESKTPPTTRRVGGKRDRAPEPMRGAKGADAPARRLRAHEKPEYDGWAVSKTPGAVPATIPRLRAARAAVEKGKRIARQEDPARAAGRALRRTLNKLRGEWLGFFRPSAVG